MHVMYHVDVCTCNLDIQKDVIMKLSVFIAAGCYPQQVTTLIIILNAQVVAHLSIHQLNKLKDVASNYTYLP